MTPQDFIAKWCAAELKERSASQSHFNDQCALPGPLTEGEFLARLLRLNQERSA